MDGSLIMNLIMTQIAALKWNDIHLRWRNRANAIAWSQCVFRKMDERLSGRWFCLMKIVETLK